MREIRATAPFGIIRQSDGHISVDTEVGRGTTFKIYLPCAGEKITETTPSPPAGITGEMLAGAETILIVEDKADVRQLAATVLRSYRYNVLEAGDGLEALQVAAQYNGPIHLLLTDVVMPRMNGSALAQELSQRQPEMRVLYMSGYADDAILEQGTLAPGTTFLAKPFSVEGLVQKVRAVLGLAQEAWHNEENREE